MIISVRKLKTFLTDFFYENLIKQFVFNLKKRCEKFNLDAVLITETDKFVRFVKFGDDIDPYQGIGAIKKAPIILDNGLTGAVNLVGFGTVATHTPCQTPTVTKSP